MKRTVVAALLSLALSGPAVGAVGAAPAPTSDISNAQGSPEPKRSPR
mgnify:CR=1 FL=1